jgi:hypothetical protein
MYTIGSREGPSQERNKTMRNRTTLTSFTTYLEGQRFIVKVTKTDDFSGRSGKTKAFVWGTPDPEELGQTVARPMYSMIGDDPVNDAAWKAYNKLEIANQRHFVEAAIEGKFGFSRKAGCSMCPCSPGFVMKDGSYGYNTTFNITVTR